MSKRIVKVKHGSSVPDHYVYLKSERLPTPEEATYEWEPTRGIRGMIPIFGTETLYKTTPIHLYHFYEVKDDNNNEGENE